MRRTATFVVGMVVGVVLWGTALAAIPDSGGVIHACYQNPPPSGGANLAVIDTAAGGHCSGGKVEITWNRTGPQGPTGPAGARGATGPQGDTGPAGASVIERFRETVAPPPATCCNFTVPVELAWTQQANTLNLLRAHLVKTGGCNVSFAGGVGASVDGVGVVGDNISLTASNLVADIKFNERTPLFEPDSNTERTFTVDTVWNCDNLPQAQGASVLFALDVVEFS